MGDGFRVTVNGDLVTVLKHEGGSNWLEWAVFSRRAALSVGIALIAASRTADGAQNEPGKGETRIFEA